MKVFNTLASALVLMAVSSAFHLKTGPSALGSLRQDEGEEDSAPSGVTTERPTNGHLIGTLAGILAAIIRTGANSTSPINLNLTAALQRLTRFQLFPIFPPRQKQALETNTNPAEMVGNTIVLPLLLARRSLQKRATRPLKYKNPTRSPLYEVYNVFTTTSIASTIQTEDEEVTERVNTQSRPIQSGSSGPYIPPSSFPMYPVVSTTETYAEEFQANQDLRQPNLDRELAQLYGKPKGQPQASVPLQEPEVPEDNQQANNLDFSNIDLINLNPSGTAIDYGLYLTPAVNLVKAATRNVTLSTVTGLVNGTAAGFISLLGQIPTFAETVGDLVDFFGR